MFEGFKLKKLGLPVDVKNTKKKNMDNLNDFEVNMWREMIPIFYEQGFRTMYSQQDKTFYMMSTGNNIDKKRLLEYIEQQQLGELFIMFKELSLAFYKDGNQGYHIVVL